MDKRQNAILNEYLKEVSNKLICSNEIKKSIISELKDGISEYFENHPDANKEDLIEEFGTPEEISKSIESREDIDNLNNKVKKSRLRTVLLVGAIVVLVVAIVLISVITISNNQPTSIETTKEEVSINLKNGKYVTPKYGYTIEIDNGMITCPKKTDIASSSSTTAVPVKYEIKNNRLYADKYIFDIKDGSRLVLVSGIEGISAGAVFEYQSQ